MASLFISYSRKDIEFARKLTEAFTGQDLDFWIDWEGIPPTVDWWKEIQKGIEEADIFLFLISPDSAKSRICRQEIEHAAKNGKRLIPVIVRDISADESPAELRTLNWIFLRNPDEFHSGFSKLITAIKTDYEWVQVHRQLLVKALEWERSNHENSFLLRGKELQDAESQLVTNSSGEPHPTELQREYVLKSRQASDRQRRTTTSIAVAGVVTLAILAVFGFLQARLATSNAAEAQAASTLAISNANTAQAASTLAFNNAATAQANAEEAQRQAQISRAGELAAQSVEMRDRDFHLSLLLGIEAIRLWDNVLSRGTMLDQVNANPRLLQFFVGHTESISDVAFSPDGKTFASSSYDDHIILWDMETRRMIGHPLTGHEDRVLSIAFSPDGKTLASGGIDNHIILWDIATQSLIGGPLTGHTDAVRSVTFSPDGKTLVSGSNDKTIILWDVATAQPLSKLDQLNATQHVAFSPNGGILASLKADSSIALWDTTTYQTTGYSLMLDSTHFIGEVVTDMAFSPKGNILAAGSSCKIVIVGRFPCPEGDIILWDVITHELISPPLGHTGDVSSVAFSPDGNVLAAGTYEGTIILWDMATRLPIGEPLTGHTSNVTGLAFSPDGQYLISGSDDHNIILWDISTVLDTSLLSDPPIGRILKGHAENVLSIAFSPDGTILVSGDLDGSLLFWDTATGQPVGTPLTEHFGYVQNTAFSPDGNMLATVGNSEKSIILWDAHTHKVIGRLLLEDITYGVNEIGFSSDGKTLVSISDTNSITFWNVATQKAVGSPLILDGASTVTVSPDGKILASSDAEDVITLWDAATGQPMGESFPGYTSSSSITFLTRLLFSPDNKIVATVSNNSSITSITLWDVATHQPIGQPIVGHKNSAIPVAILSLAFSPDGKFLAAGNQDNTISLWDVATRQAIGQPFTVNADFGTSINSLAFSPDGKRVASGGDDQNVIVWDLTLQNWIEQSCQRAGANFTQTEWRRYFQNEEYRKTCEPWPLELEISATPTATP